MASALFMLVSGDKKSNNPTTASQSPPQPACSAALKQEPVAAPALDEACTDEKQRADVLKTLCLMELSDRLAQIKLDMAERMQRLEESQHTLEESKRDKALAIIVQGLDLLGSLKDRTNVDERTKMQFEDHIKSLVLPPSSKSSAV
jgi:hypothetical protein